MSCYTEKFKDPRWQKKRLEILEREKWMCEDCGDKATQLHIHHGYYEKGLDPWDYNSDTLHCLCKDCHEYQQDTLRDMQYELAKMPIGYIDPTDIQLIVRYCTVLKWFIKKPNVSSAGRLLHIQRLIFDTYVNTKNKQIKKILDKANKKNA